MTSPTGGPGEGTGYPELLGLHHVTAICGDPAHNLQFYSGVLGLRLVKKTVNFDDPGSYHLYYGDGIGSPGTLMTFFAWTSVPPLASARGKPGIGTIVRTGFRVPEGSFDYWVDRLAAGAHEFDAPSVRFSERGVVARDPEGMEIELVAAGPDGPSARCWREGPIPAEHAIRGLHSVGIMVSDPGPASTLLTDVLGFEEEGSDGTSGSGGESVRFRVGGGDAVGHVELVVRPGGPEGRIGIGSVHHVAWRAESDDQQLAWQGALTRNRVGVTPVMDRQYFRSIYFNEPGGVIFEIATDPPGFTIDEPETELGTGLKLPPWLEPRRAAIEARLPVLGQSGSSVPAETAGERDGLG